MRNCECRTFRNGERNHYGPQFVPLPPVFDDDDVAPLFWWWWLWSFGCWVAIDTMPGCGFAFCKMGFTTAVEVGIISLWSCEFVFNFSLLCGVLSVLLESSWLLMSTTLNLVLSGSDIFSWGPAAVNLEVLGDITSEAADDVSQSIKDFLWIWSLNRFCGGVAALLPPNFAGNGAILEKNSPLVSGKSNIT